MGLMNEAERHLGNPAPEREMIGSEKFHQPRSKMFQD